MRSKHAEQSACFFKKIVKKASKTTVFEAFLLDKSRESR